MYICVQYIYINTLNNVAVFTKQLCYYTTPTMFSPTDAYAGFLYKKYRSTQQNNNKNKTIKKKLLNS